MNEELTCSYTGAAKNNKNFQAACLQIGKLDDFTFSTEWLDPFYSNYIGNDKEAAYAFLTSDMLKSSTGGRRHRGSKKAHKGKRHGNASLRAWVTFVKKVQKEEGIGYKEAMSVAKKRKDGGEKWRGGGNDDEMDPTEPGMDPMAGGRSRSRGRSSRRGRSQRRSRSSSRGRSQRRGRSSRRSRR